MEIQPEEFERTFPVGDQAELVLSNITGTVDVRGWDYPEIKVAGVKRLGGVVPWVSPIEGFQATRIEMEQQGSRVVVRTARRFEGFWSFLQWLGGVARVDYTVRVPRRCAVVLDLVSGRLLVDDVQGNVICRTVSGSQSLRHLGGNLVVTTVSGGVDAEALRGKAAFRTVSGGIRARSCEFDSLSGRSVSGSFEVETPLAQAGVYDFESVSGGVRLALARGGCTAEVESLSGSLRSELPSDLRETRRGHWRGEVNGGGPRIRLKSVSGGLRVVGTAGASALPAWSAEPSRLEAGLAERLGRLERPAPAAESAAAEPASRESIMVLILTAVEKGELTVEEAATKLAELDALTRADQAHSVHRSDVETSAGQGATAEATPERSEGQANG